MESTVDTESFFSFSFLVCVVLQDLSNKNQIHMQIMTGNGSIFLSAYLCSKFKQLITLRFDIRLRQICFFNFA